MAYNVAAEFEEASVDWRTALQADEWFFVRLIERLVDALAPSEAFQNIGGVAELILREAESNLLFDEGCLLLALARQSETTELHPVLEEHWDRVLARLPEMLADQLVSWYRKSPA
jgi:hypothetical protein